MWLPGTVRRLGAGMVLVAGGCLLPSDRSGDLRLVFDPVPAMYAGDTVQLAVRTADPAAAGAVLPEDIEFESSNPATLEVTPSGRAVAHFGGIVTVTARVSFADAAPSQLEVTILNLLRVDSVVPGTVWFGDTLRVYGVGLNPGMATTMVGGLPAPVVDYQRAVASSAGGPGVLTVLVPAASVTSSVTATRLTGVSATGPVPVTVIQQDRLEPNDATPRSLGAVSSVLAWRALALEGSPVGTPAGRDWYTFVNPTRQSVTLTLRAARRTSVDELSLLVTDTLDANAGVLPQGWALEIGANYCRGAVIRGFRGTLDSQVIGLYDLAPGTYHVLVGTLAPSPTPQEYDLRLEPGYHSALGADSEEWNYRCTQASDGEGFDLTFHGSDRPRVGTIASPGAVDWYVIPLSAYPVSLTLDTLGTAIRALGTALEVLTDAGTSVAGGVSPSGSGPTELVFCQQANTNYVVAVTDILGIPSRYHLHMAPLQSAACPPTPVGPAR